MNEKQNQTPKVRRFNKEIAGRSRKPKLWQILAGGGLIAVLGLAAVLLFPSPAGQVASEELAGNTANSPPSQPEAPSGEDNNPVVNTRAEPEGPSEEPVPARTEVGIPLEKIDDYQAHYFSYTISSGKKVRFFVLKSSDDVFRAAFDACDVCYGAKRGYRQEGNVMICNNCGQQFDSVRINEEKGGCNPAPLDREVRDDTLVLQIADIEKGGFYF